MTTVLEALRGLIAHWRAGRVQNGHVKIRENAYYTAREDGLHYQVRIDGEAGGGCDLSAEAAAALAEALSRRPETAVSLVYAGVTVDPRGRAFYALASFLVVLAADVSPADKETWSD